MQNLFVPAKHFCETINLWQVRLKMMPQQGLWPIGGEGHVIFRILTQVQLWDTTFACNMIKDVHAIHHSNLRIQYLT